jgi:hypothetical protein
MTLWQHVGTYLQRHGGSVNSVTLHKGANMTLWQHVGTYMQAAAPGRRGARR